MWVKTLHSINQTLYNWLTTVSKEMWIGGGFECRYVSEVHMPFCTQTRIHRYTKTNTLKQSTVPLFAFMQVDTLISLLQALTAFHYWEKKKKSPWQQLLQFVGCNACDDIIRTSSNNTDQRYLLMRIPTPVNQNLMCPQTKRRGNPPQKGDISPPQQQPTCSRDESCNEAFSVVCQMLKEASLFIQTFTIKRGIKWVSALGTEACQRLALCSAERGVLYLSPHQTKSIFIQANCSFCI